MRKKLMAGPYLLWMLVFTIVPLLFRFLLRLHFFGRRVHFFKHNRDL